MASAFARGPLSEAMARKRVPFETRNPSSRGRLPPRGRRFEIRDVAAAFGTALNRPMLAGGCCCIQRFLKTNNIPPTLLCTLAPSVNAPLERTGSLQFRLDRATGLSSRMRERSHRETGQIR